MPIVIAKQHKFVSLSSLSLTSRILDDHRRRRGRRRRCSYRNQATVIRYRKLTLDATVHRGGAAHSAMERERAVRLLAR